MKMNRAYCATLYHVIGEKIIISTNRGALFIISTKIIYH